MATRFGEFDRDTGTMGSPMRGAAPTSRPSGVTTLPMIDPYMAMMHAAALITAAEIGLFEALASGPLDAANLAARTGANARGVSDLAEYLIAVGYLERTGDRIANGAHASNWFTSMGTVDYTPGLLWSGNAWDLMRSLTDSVRAGGPATSLWDRMLAQPELSGAFSAYMHAFAKDLSGDLLEVIQLPRNTSRLLDLGGSHGIHSIALCQRCPELHAVIVDLASAFTFTEQLIAQNHLSERIRLRPGNLNNSDWGGEYDIILLLSVAHNQAAAENRRTFERMFEALRPGGLVIIHDYLASDGLAYHAAFQLTLLVETGTRIHSYEEFDAWLDDAGFEDICRKDLEPREKGTLIMASRPA